MAAGRQVFTPSTLNSRGVAVSDMDGADFHAKLVQAVCIARAQDVPLIMPGGQVDLSQTWVWSEVEGAKDASDLFDNMTIVGNGTVIKWTGGTDSAMFEMPSPNRVTIQGPMFLDGQGVSGVIGMWCRTAWDFNRNGMRNLDVQNVSFQNLAVAGWVGDALGPDFRPNQFNCCFVTGCEKGFVFQGPNVTTTTISGSSINCSVYGVELIDSATDVDGLLFDATFASGKITDPWGNAWTPDMHDNADYPTGPPVWNARVLDSSGDARGSAGYGGDAEAKVIVGGPVVSVRDCDAAMSLPSSVFLKVRRCSVHASSIRLEGSGDLYECTETWFPGFAATRFYSVIEDCTSANSGVAINNQGGPPVVVKGGRYSGTIETHASATTYMVGPIYANGTTTYDGA